MFAAMYVSFFINDKPKNDIFQFDDLCSDFACLITSAFKSEYLIHLLN